MSSSPIAGPNAEQIAYWNQEAGTRWVAIQQRIDALFVDMTAAALDSAAAQLGDCVLDVGCGCGATVLELARRVGPAGRVVGVDVSRPMLDLATERVRAERLDNVALQLADASTFQFEDAKFDLAFSRFGIMFFDDPVGAFTNIRRSLRAGGRIAFLAWCPLSENPWFTVPLTAALRHVAPPEAPDPQAPGPFAFADAKRVCRILEDAGFKAIAVQRRDAMMKLAEPNDVERGADLASSVGPASRALAAAGADARAAAKAAIADALREHDGPDGVRLPARVWFVLAQA